MSEGLIVLHPGKNKETVEIYSYFARLYAII